MYRRQGLAATNPLRHANGDSRWLLFRSMGMSYGHVDVVAGGNRYVEHGREGETRERTAVATKEKPNQGRLPLVAQHRGTNRRLLLHSDTHTLDVIFV